MILPILVALILTVYGGTDTRKPRWRCVVFDHAQERCVAFEKVKQ